MNKKIVLHIIQSLDNGGCENMLLRTLPLLSDFEHKIITLNHKGELAEQFEKKSIPLVNIAQKNTLDIFSYFGLLKEIKKSRPNLIITYLFHADMIGRLFLQVFTKIKIIPFLRTTYNHEKYWLARLFEKLTKYFAKSYLSNSESVKNFYIENIGVKKENITVIPNGIDIDFYDSIERDENLRRGLGIKENNLAIICVSNLHINKGHTYLLEAFEKTYKENENIKLLLVGNGDEKENLLKQIKNYNSKNNILFLGKRIDIAQLLKISDIFVLPTLFEGMSNAIMEAMACELPVITTDIPENRELIKDLRNGILVPTKDSGAISNSLLQLILNKDKRTTLAFSAKKTIATNYSLHTVIQKWKETLNKI